MLDTADNQLAEFFTQYSKIFVLTGAGCSTASGLGDYRDKQGQWKRAQPITGQTFINDEMARKRYWARSSVGWPSFSKAEPGEAHSALCQLQRNGYLHSLVTQNVDQLHQKAGHQHVVDLHGVLASVSCLDCSKRIARDAFQDQLIDNNHWLESLTADHAPDGDADLELSDLDAMQVPNCTACGGLLKPDVVFFGETVPKRKVQSAMTELAQSDALIVVGSSLMVYSGFRFCREAEKLNKPIVIINNGITRGDELSTLKVQGDCGSRLTKLTQSLDPTGS